MSIQLWSRRVSSQVRLAILEIQRNDRPRISSLSYLRHRQASSSYFQELTCMVKAWFQFSSFFSTKSGVVQKVCLPTFSLTQVPFLILLSMMASTTVVLNVLLGALLQSFTLASFFLSQKMLISTFPLFLLMNEMSKVKSLLMSSFSLRQMRLTPRNFFRPLISHHDSVMILYIQDQGNLKVSLKMYSPSLLKMGYFQVWQFSSPYLSTRKGVPVMSLGPRSSNFIDLIAISRAGTCTTFSILISDTSINAILCLSLLKISTRSLGISGLLKSSTPDPINLQAQKTDRVRWDSWSCRSKMESQLQRCLSEGMKQGLIFFQALPIFMRKVGISQKVLDFRQTRQSQLFFMGLLQGWIIYLNADFLAALPQDLPLLPALNRHPLEDLAAGHLASPAVLPHLLDPKLLHVVAPLLKLQPAHHLQLQIPHRNNDHRLHLYLHQPVRLPFLEGYCRLGEDNGVMSFRVRWSKSKSSERVTAAQVSLFYGFVGSGATQLGMATGRITGYNIAEGSIAGVLTIQKGTGQSSITSTNLTLNNYNLLTTQVQMTQSLNYLNYQYSALPINLPSDMLELTMLVNYASYLTSSQTPSVLGQLIWSWIQYFPIFLSIYWVLDKAFCFLLREKIVRSTLSHDQEYLTLISQQTSRRERLRQL